MTQAQIRIVRRLLQGHRLHRRQRDGKQWFWICGSHIDSEYVNDATIKNMTAQGWLYNAMITGEARSQIQPTAKAMERLKPSRRKHAEPETAHHG